MPSGSSTPDPAASPGSAGTGPLPYDPTGLPTHAPTVSAAQAGLVPGHPASDRTTRADGPPDVRRYGPGIPAVPPARRPELTAERAWRTGARGRSSRGWGRLARLSGSALTVILLAASGVLLYLRLHHEPVRVTAGALTQQTRNGCGVDVTGRINTNGSAGTVSYEWLFRSDPQSPQALDQSVEAGQQAAFVTIAVQGQGHGSTSQTVTLQVLGVHPQAASAAVVVSCP